MYPLIFKVSSTFVTIILELVAWIIKLAHNIAIQTIQLILLTSQLLESIGPWISAPVLDS
jgi:hypothetical protein